MTRIDYPGTDLDTIHDENGNPTSLVYPGGVEAVTTYDFADRPSSLLARRPGLPDQPLVTAAGYLPSGPLASLTLGSDLTESRSFTSRYFPSEIALSGAADLLRWTYSTDSVGNILSITDNLTPSASRTYAYQDFQYFLTQGNGPWGTRSWSYDRIGNRLTETRGAVTDAYSYLPNPGGGRTIPDNMTCTLRCDSGRGQLVCNNDIPVLGAIVEILLDKKPECFTDPAQVPRGWPPNPLWPEG